MNYNEIGKEKNPEKLPNRPKNPFPIFEITNLFDF